MVIRQTQPDVAKAITVTFSVSKYQIWAVYLSLNDNSIPTSLSTRSHFSLCTQRCKLPPSCGLPVRLFSTHIVQVTLKVGLVGKVLYLKGMSRSPLGKCPREHIYIYIYELWHYLMVPNFEVNWQLLPMTFSELRCRRPYHIRVRLYGMFDDTCVVRRRASVPAAVQPDQWAAAVVACELTIWECRKHVLKTNDIINSEVNSIHDMEYLHSK